MLIGMLLVAVGSIPKDVIFLLNQNHFPQTPWLVVPTTLYLWIYWRYLSGAWEPASTSEGRRRALRANAMPARVWLWALLAGTVALTALVLVLQAANRMVEMPTQDSFDVAKLSVPTIVAMIVVGAVEAAVVEESAFRGYMQGPIEGRFGIVAAVLITGVMFGLAHLGVTPILMPYYIAVAALYGVIAWLTNSILPSMVLHALGNVVSSTWLWLTGHAEWQQSAIPQPLIWDTGVDQGFLNTVCAAAVALAATVWAYGRLARAARRTDPRTAPFPRESPGRGT